jgi:perosamine synthetase
MSDALHFWAPRIGPSCYPLVKQVLDSAYLNEGDVATAFEQKLAGMLGVKHCVATTSGTAAIALALRACGVGHGDEVIVPDVTFIATANAVHLTGATPVLVDIDGDTLDMSPAAFEKAITPHTKAVVPVHVSGRSGRLGEILEIAKRKGLFVVEDAAEALLSKYQGRCLGSFGVAGCFSFSANKTITTGQGGAVITNDDNLRKKLQELKDQGRPVRGTGGDDLHHSVGYNFKLTNVQAAIGLSQLEELPARAARLKDIYRRYVAGLQGIANVRVLKFDVEHGESPQWVDAVVDKRDELDQYLRAHEIYGRRYWFPIHTQPAYRVSSERFPISTQLCPKALWLPSSFTLSDAQISRVCGRIRDFYAVASGKKAA